MPTIRRAKFSNLFRRLGSDINDAMARWLLKKAQGAVSFQLYRR